MVRAIDVHVHPMTKEWFEGFGVFSDALEKLLHVQYKAKTEEEMASDFRRENVLAMMIAWDAATATGDPVITNDWVASLTQKFPDVFLPGWAVIDPWKGKAALQELERAISTLGLKGAKFQPPVQAFHPNDRRFFPIWDLCQSLGAPVLIHQGTTAMGTGMAGGRGVMLKYGRPIPGIDDVAANFPRLTIIAAHPGWPWHEELIAVLVHKDNVFFEVSGWRPKFIPESIKKQIHNRLQDKVMFGSDYPGWGIDQCLVELEMEGFKPNVLEKMFVKNATRVLKLEDAIARATAKQAN
jgi:predicted TIM-barrel fold metal-dependent hydrolase